MVKIYELFFSMSITLPKVICDMVETYLKICLLNVVWKPRDVFLVDGINRLKCLYTIQADANPVKLKITKLWQEQEKETEEEQKDIIKNIRKTEKITGRHIVKLK